MLRPRFACLALCALIAAPAAGAQTMRFSWLPRSIDPGEIRIESPPYLPGQDLGFKPLRHQSWIKRGEVLVQVGEGAQARAYPLRLLAAFRVITDRDAAGPFAVSYCVPCAWIRVFRLPKGMEEAQFSGLWSAHGLDAAEKSHPAALDPLFYDPATGSLFSHRLGRGVAGPLDTAVLEDLPYRFTHAWTLEEDQEDLSVLGPVGKDVYELDAAVKSSLTMDLFEGPHLLLKAAPYYANGSARPKAEGPATVVDGTTFRAALRDQPKPKSMARYPGFNTSEPVLGFMVSGEPAAIPLSSLMRRGGEALALSRGKATIEALMDPAGRIWEVTINRRRVPSWPLRLGAWAAGKATLWMPAAESVRAPE